MMIWFLPADSLAGTEASIKGSSSAADPVSRDMVTIDESETALAATPETVSAVQKAAEQSATEQKAAVPKAATAQKSVKVQKTGSQASSAAKSAQKKAARTVTLAETPVPAAQTPRRPTVGRSVSRCPPNLWKDGTATAPT